MARQVRVEYPDAFYHVINRGYNKMWIFHDDQDFMRFSEDLEVVFHSHSIVIHAFCIMNNHIHLFVETPLGNLSKAMHRLFSRYALYYKKKYDLKGKVFEKRYAAFLVETELYALELTRYIHQNPIGVTVSEPLSWKYSSYRVYQRLDEKPIFMDVDLVLKRFDKNEVEARSKMKEYMYREESSSWYPEDYILGKSILGSISFVKRIKDKLPQSVNSELSGLITLSEEDKVQELKTYISKLNLPIDRQMDLLIYSIRKKTHMTRAKLNQTLGTQLGRNSLSYLMTKVKKLALQDLKIAKALIELQSI